MTGEIFLSFQSTFPKNTYYKGIKSNFSIEKPGKHYFDQVILTSNRTSWNCALLIGIIRALHRFYDFPAKNA